MYGQFRRRRLQLGHAAHLYSRLAMQYLRTSPMCAGGTCRITTRECWQGSQDSHEGEGPEAAGKATVCLIHERSTKHLLLRFQTTTSLSASKNDGLAPGRTVHGKRKNTWFSKERPTDSPSLAYRACCRGGTRPGTLLPRCPRHLSQCQAGRPPES